MEIEDSDYDKILKESSPYNIYKELEDEVKDVTDGQHCTEFEGITSTHKEKYVILYKKVSKLLDFVFKKETSENYKDYCLHYRYWVYNELRKLVKDDKQSNDITEIIKKFMKLQATIFSNHQKYGCSLGFVTKDLAELNYKTEEKYLYDYFKNYNTIKCSETCTKVNNGKYKKYLQSIDKIYKNLKEDCCIPWDWDCSNYFLSCKDEFDPRRLLSALGSNDNESCEGLKSIKAIFKDEKLNPETFSSDFLKSLNYGACYSPKDGTFTSGDAVHPFCNLYTAPVQLSSSVTIVRSNEPQGNGAGSPADNSYTVRGEDQEQEKQAQSVPPKEVTDETNENEGGSGSYGEHKKKASPDEDTHVTFRWKLDTSGQLKCPTTSTKKAELGICDYMEELIEGGFATKTKSGMYRLNIKTKWTTDDLRTYRERIRSRRSTHELNTDYFNILNNIFIRISTGVALFTPFGSRLRRHKKRKQRYRFDFTDLSTRKRPRRFLKRTYRHSDRRRFNVVNIEDELHSSNDY
ncbi:PIR Superfamily Protein [Plasmodium malariae]|uniref:PIR Superfamily Protein n=1 Tax=Plasmodium malariae TaxID=5858 RepID=A0A1A8X116_PLAMA|nr:PIR Superfamily Protein [Plasmodium malariae]